MVTQKDIAEGLGVSVTLVSRILSGKGPEIGASPATIRSVEETAIRLGYVPNYQAQVLRGAPALTLGVVVYDFEDPFFGSMIRHLQSYAREEGYTLILVGTDQGRISDQEVELFRRHRIDRLVILGSALDLTWVDRLKDPQLSIQQIGAGPKVDGLTRIAVDETAGFHLLLEHLVQAGVKTAAYLGPSAGPRTGRRDAFFQCLEQTSIQPSKGWNIEPRGMSFLHGSQAAASLTDLPREAWPDVVVCANDQLAIGVMSRLEEAGISVPGDMRVSGFDDIPMARFCRPPLTTLKQPVDRMVEKLFHSAGPLPGGTLLLPPELRIRRSA